MKRSFKNLIMIILLCLIVVSMYFTYDYAKNNLSNTQIEQGIAQMSAPSSEEVPDKPDGETDDLEASGEEVPDKPDGETEDLEEPEIDVEMSVDGNMEMSENSESQMEMAEEGMMQESTASEVELTTAYIVAFSIEGLLFSIILIYLIMSIFNKKSIKETFSTTDKILIYILSSIILTSAITYGCKVGAEYLLNNTDTTDINESNKINDTNINSNTSDISYSSSTTITEDTTITSGTYSSTESNENVVSVDGNIDVELSNVEVTKSGDSNSGDNSNFYGINSAIIAKNGANLTIENATITTDGEGANGVFSYGGYATTSNTSTDGTTVTIKNSTITTTADNSGGIMTTGGGITYAYDLTITTAGTSSAAIRTDRGGGTVKVYGGTYKTTGSGSPAIYSTANITVSDATLISTTSEGIVIEGKNSVAIDNVTLTDSNTKLNGQSTTYKNIFLYQSMSGDADTGTSEFTATNSTITTNNGDTFYITNTTAIITLENNTFINNDSTGYFLRAQADSWGTTGSNGADVTLNIINQSAKGDIYIDSISTLDMNMSSNSYYEGTINGDNTSNNISLKLDSTSSIKLTGDSYITSLADEDTTYSNIDFNGYTLYVNGTAIN